MFVSRLSASLATLAVASFAFCYGPRVGYVCIHQRYYSFVPQSGVTFMLQPSVAGAAVVYDQAVAAANDRYDQDCGVIKRLHPDEDQVSADLYNTAEAQQKDAIADANSDFDAGLGSGLTYVPVTEIAPMYREALFVSDVSEARVAVFDLDRSGKVSTFTYVEPWNGYKGRTPFGYTYGKTVLNKTFLKLNGTAIHNSKGWQDFVHPKIHEGPLRPHVITTGLPPGPRPPHGPVHPTSGPVQPPVRGPGSGHKDDKKGNSASGAGNSKDDKKTSSNKKPR